MKQFWLRFIFFSILWGVLLLHSTFIPYHFFLFAVSLALFFLLSFRKKEIYLFLANLLIVAFAGIFFTTDDLLPVALLWYLIFIASLQLQKAVYISFLTGAIIICSVLVFLPPISYQLLMASAFIFVLSMFIQKQASSDQYYRTLYEELSDSYRQLKRMHFSAEENARMEERTRIARDMHDSVGHHLTALSMQLEIIGMNHPEVNLDKVKELAASSLQETRDAVKALKVEEIEGIATVVNLIRKLESESHLNVHFTMKQGVVSVPISNAISVILYRVIQEGITNAMRHANSREVFVTLGQSADNAIQFEVMNKLYEEKPFEMGFGLKNMRSRVEELGGKLQVAQFEKKFIVSGRIPN